MYNQRCLHLPNISTRREDIWLEGNYNKTLDCQIVKGKKILAFDNHRIIAFATEDNLHILCESTDVQSDNTFKTVPKLFHQLYTLHVSVGSGSSLETLPVVYATVCSAS